MAGHDHMFKKLHALAIHAVFQTGDQDVTVSFTGKEIDPSIDGNGQKIGVVGIGFAKLRHGSGCYVITLILDKLLF
jgi:hypothetical protein